MNVKRIKAHRTDAVKPKTAAPPKTPALAPAGGLLPQGADLAVTTFHPKSAAKLSPLTIADLEEVRSSLAAEGFVIPEERFTPLLEEVEDRLVDGSVSDAIRQAKHWLASSPSGSSAPEATDTSTSSPRSHKKGRIVRQQVSAHGRKAQG